MTAATDTFDRILRLEDAVRCSAAVQAFTTTGASDFRKGQQSTGHAADKARLSAALDALSPEEFAAFGAYRAEVLSDRFAQTRGGS